MPESKIERPAPQLFLPTQMGFTNEKMLVGMCNMQGLRVEPYLKKNANFVNYYTISNPFGLDKEYIIHLTEDCRIICKEHEVWLNEKLQEYVNSVM